MLYGNCPSCHSEIPQERLMDPIVICPHCSEVQSTKALSFEKSMNRSYLFGALTFTLFILSSLFVLNEWGSHWTTALPAKVKQISGIALPSDIKSLATVYIELGRPLLATPYLKKHAQMRPNQLEPIRDLGNHYYMLKQFNKAESVLSDYKNIGGKEAKPLFHLARVLSKSGKVDQATQIFKNLLATKPGIFQHTIAKSLVDHLILHGQIDDAIKAIKSFQKLGANTKNFMAAELEKLNPKKHQKRS